VETDTPSSALGALFRVGPAIYNPFFMMLAKAAKSTTSLSHYADRLGWPAPFPRTLRLAGQALLQKRDDVLSLLLEREIRPVDATCTFLDTEPFPGATVRLSNEFLFGGITEPRSHWPVLLREVKFLPNGALEKPITSFDFEGTFAEHTDDLDDSHIWQWPDGIWNLASSVEFPFFAGTARITRRTHWHEGAALMLKLKGTKIWTSTVAQTNGEFPTFHKVVYMRKPAEDGFEAIRVHVRQDCGPRFQGLNQGSEFGQLEYTRTIYLPRKAQATLIVPYKITDFDMNARMITQNCTPVRIESGDTAGAIATSEALSALKTLLTLNGRCWDQPMKDLHTILGVPLLNNPPERLSDLLVGS
jgi:hypothetical protein